MWGGRREKSLLFFFAGCFKVLPMASDCLGHHDTLHRNDIHMNFEFILPESNLEKTSF
jgi:hypothetical protein